MVDFICYQYRLLTTADSEHGGPFFYHVIVLLIGCFPSSVVALPAFTRNRNSHFSVSLFKTWMIILFFVVLIIFSIVKTKIIHYSSLCYFPLSFLAAYTMENSFYSNKLLKLESCLLGIIGILIGMVLTLPPFIIRFKNKIIESGVIKDEFVVENLNADVHWSGFESLPGIIFVVGVFVALAMMRKNILRSFVFIFLLCMFTVNTVLLIVVPKIESYVQGAAIEFFQSLKGKEVYVETIGYKSYAHLFYSEKKPHPFIPRDSLIAGNISKPAYFSAKITKAGEISERYPQLKELYRKNGFVFYSRE
jgi:hypothetical protein